MKIPIIDQKALVTGEVIASGAIFGTKASSSLVAQAVRVFLSNQRKARAKAKTRSEVFGSGAKIWRQKGTGHARHGNRKAPLFVGGGVSHGPTGKQNFHLKMNRKTIRKVAISLLSDKLGEKKLFLTKDLDFKKTKEAFDFISQVQKNLKVKKGISFLIAPKENIGRYLRNLDNVLVINAASLNPYQLLVSQPILITEKAYEEITKKYS